MALGIRSVQLILESAVLLARWTSDLVPPWLPQTRLPCGLPVEEVNMEILGQSTTASAWARLLRPKAG